MRICSLFSDEKSLIYFIISFSLPLVLYCRAAAVEEELRQIADEQHTNVNKLVDLVKENEIILDVMRVSVA